MLKDWQFFLREKCPYKASFLVWVTQFLVFALLLLLKMCPTSSSSSSASCPMSGSAIFCHLSISLRPALGCHWLMSGTLNTNALEAIHWINYSESGAKCVVFWALFRTVIYLISGIHLDRWLLMCIRGWRQPPAWPSVSGQWQSVNTSSTWIASTARLGSLCCHILLTWSWFTISK